MKNDTAPGKGDTRLLEEWRRAERRLKVVLALLFAAAIVALFLVFALRVSLDDVPFDSQAVYLLIYIPIIAAFIAAIYLVIRRLMLKAYLSETRLLTVGQISTDAVFLIDGALSIRAWSEGARRVFGYTQEEALGRDISILVPDPMPEEDDELVEMLVRDGVALQFRTTRMRKNGELFPAETSLSTIKGPDGETLGLLAVLRDITGQVAMEDELKRTNAELDAYAQVVSHDLKAPLTTMKLAADTLVALLASPKVDAGDPRVPEMASVISRNVDDAARLIHDILSLAEAGQEPTDVESVNVGETVERILSERGGAISEAGTRVRVGDLGTVVASPTHLYQLFSNLVGNAIRHSGSVRPLVEVRRLDDKDGLHRFLVRDNGGGIPPENLDRIFEPFFKGETGDTGLGLSTVRKIVGVYGGEIRVYNDGGACFEFTLRDHA